MTFQAPEPRAYQVGVGVNELRETVQGALPGDPRGVRPPAVVVRVTESRERAGLVVAVTELAIQDQGLAVAGNGPVVVTEMVVGIAEAVPSVRLAVPVADLLVQGKGLLAMEEGLSVFSELRQVPAD